jgi:hypothetical protein
MVIDNKHTGKVQVIDPKTEERNTLHSPTNAVAVLTTHNDRVYFTTQNPNTTDIYGHKMYSFSGASLSP